MVVEVGVAPAGVGEATASPRQHCQGHTGAGGGGVGRVRSMTPECSRCGSKSIAHVNGVGRQCLMCGEEHAQEGQDAALAMKVAAVAIQERWRSDLVMTARAAAAAARVRYKLVLQWVRGGELPSTDWNPRQSRRGRRVGL